MRMCGICSEEMNGHGNKKYHDECKPAALRLETKRYNERKKTRATTPAIKNHAVVDIDFYDRQEQAKRNRLEIHKELGILKPDNAYFNRFIQE